MRSFAFFVAALSFGAFSWAAPTPLTPIDIIANVNLDVGLDRRQLANVVVDVLGLDVDALLDVRSDIEVNRRQILDATVDADVLGLITADVDIDLRSESESYGNQYDKDTLAGVLNSIIRDLTPLTEKLGGLDSTDCTEDNVQGLVNEIVKILDDAVADLLKLVGKEVSDILKTVDGVLDATGLAKLLCEVLTLIFTAIGLVLDIVSEVLRLNVIGILCAVVPVVLRLLQTVLQLVDGVLDGVLSILCGLIGDLLPIIKELGYVVDGLLQFLGLSY